MSIEIENIVFARFINQKLPFEIVTIEELYDRCESSAYDLSVPHRIMFSCLIFITEGKGNHTLDFVDIPLSSGTVLALTKEQVHKFQKPLKVKGYVISLQEEFITRSVSKQNLFHFLQIFNSPAIKIAEENISVFTPYFTMIQSVHTDYNESHKAGIISLIFMAFLLEVKRHSIYRHDIYDSQHFKDFVVFRDMLTKQYSSSHKAAEYAKSMKVSYKYLNDICKEMTGHTAKVFIDNWLLLEIKRNISEKKYNSQEIAYKMGFGEPSNFIRFFKSRTGMTPSQFRKDHDSLSSG